MVERGIYRTAVCPDGTASLTDGHGRLLQVRSDGSLADDRAVPELIGVVAGACAADGTVYFASRSQQLITLQGGLPKSIRVSPLSIRPVLALAAAGREVMVLTPPLEGNVLHRVDGSGTVIASFGGKASASSQPTLGAIAWDDVKRRTTLFTEDGSEALTFDDKGKLESQRRYPEAERATPSTLLAAVRLPSGEVVRQRESRTQVGEGRYASQIQIELLKDGGSSATMGAGLGWLQGADREGNLYFQVVAKPRGIRIIKARIVE